MEPADMAYGARSYLAVDPEGHEWDFSMPLDVPESAMQEAGISVQRLRDAPPLPTFFPQAFYRDPRAAVDWLHRAFGFEPVMTIESEASFRAHLAFQDGLVAVTSELRWEGHPPRLSPASTGNANTQTVHVQLQGGIDEHCERARAAGARILQEPETQFYGDRTYRALDLEGHMWTFGQTVRVMSPEEWDAASGLRTTMGR